MPGKSGFSVDYQRLRKPCRNSLRTTVIRNQCSRHSCTWGLAVAKKMTANSWKNPHPENIWIFSSQYWWQLSKNKDTCHIVKKNPTTLRAKSCRASLDFCFRFESSASWQRSHRFPHSSRPWHWSSLSQPGAQPLWMPLSLQILAAAGPAFVPMQKKLLFSESGMKLGKIRAWFTISSGPSFTRCLCVACRACISRCEWPRSAYVATSGQQERLGPEKQVLIDWG